MHDRSSHSYPNNDNQEALFQEVCSRAAIYIMMGNRDSGQVPTGANIRKRVLRTCMPRPNETRNILIPAHHNPNSSFERAKMYDPRHPKMGHE